MKVSVQEYTAILLQEFEANKNETVAQGQQAYMKDKFPFYGIKTPIRKQIQKPFLAKDLLPNKTDAFSIIKNLWQEPFRELHYFAIELAEKYKMQSEKADLDLFEYMIIHQSWWDSVDMIATHLVGNHFRNHPEQIVDKTTNWMTSQNIWLQRTALLFQLKYKKETDTNLLENLIRQLLGSKEFFINKAIGWVLREYARTDKDWVINFVEDHELSNLSKREALKHL